MAARVEVTNLLKQSSLRKIAAWQARLTQVCSVVIMSDHSAAKPTAAAPADEEKELMDAPPDVRLLVKRRQMFEVQEALEAQTQQYAAQVDVWPFILHICLC